MDTQVWIEFLKENWLVIVVALVVLMVIVNFVKTVVKWGLVLVIVAGVIIYSGISLKDLSVKNIQDLTVGDLGKAVSAVTEQAASIGKNEVLNVMKKEAKDAKITTNSDGSFTITTPNLEVTGSKGSDKVKVSSHGLGLGEWKVNDTIESFISDAKRNAK